MPTIDNDGRAPRKQFRFMGENPRRRATLCATDNDMDKLIVYARNHLPAAWYWRVEEKTPNGTWRLRVTFRA